MKAKEFAQKIMDRYGDSDEEIVDVFWCSEDVRVCAQDQNPPVELTDDEVSEVITTLENSHDANYGINWETISYIIDDLVTNYRDK